MAERRVYVYRLDVVYPEGSDAPDWEPEGWEPMWGTEPETGAPERQVFRWPASRHCLTLGTAQRWATRLRNWGCKVEIERSEPVAWVRRPASEVDDK